VKREVVRRETRGCASWERELLRREALGGAS
jgi:hypothetical protein